MSSKNPQIFVTRLPREFNEEELKKTFRKFGRIKEATLKRGYGFVVSIFPIIGRWKGARYARTPSSTESDCLGFDSVRPAY